MHFALRPITEADARAIIEWRYAAPYSFYNPSHEALQSLLDPENAYHAVTDEHGGLAGFCCFGADARVPDEGIDEDDVTALDVGFGMRPDLTGRGLGADFVDAILAFARRHYSPSSFRMVVATFNQRAIRVYERIGFQPVRTFISRTIPREQEFLLMTMDASVD